MIQYMNKLYNIPTFIFSYVIIIDLKTGFMGPTRAPCQAYQSYGCDSWPPLTHTPMMTRGVTAFKKKKNMYQNVTLANFFAQM